MVFTFFSSHSLFIYSCTLVFLNYVVHVLWTHQRGKSPTFMRIEGVCCKIWSFRKWTADHHWTRGCGWAKEWKNSLWKIAVICSPFYVCIYCHHYLFLYIELFFASLMVQNNKTIFIRSFNWERKGINIPNFMREPHHTNILMQMISLTRTHIFNSSSIIWTFKLFSWNQVLNKNRAEIFG